MIKETTDVWQGLSLREIHFLQTKINAGYTRLQIWGQ